MPREPAMHQGLIALAIAYRTAVTTTFAYQRT